MVSLIVDTGGVKTVASCGWGRAPRVSWPTRHDYPKCIVTKHHMKDNRQTQAISVFFSVNMQQVCCKPIRYKGQNNTLNFQDLVHISRTRNCQTFSSGSLCWAEFAGISVAGLRYVSHLIHIF